MTDHMRWRYGDSNPVKAAVESHTVIEIGDLLWQDTDDAKPASMIKATDKVGQQEWFARLFLGVAMQRSRNGDTASIRVATTGVFEFDVSQGVCWELGDLVGVDCQLHGGHDEVNDGRESYSLLDQAVGTVSAVAAIGRVDKRVSPASGSVLVRIFSTVMTGGMPIR